MTGDIQRCYRTLELEPGASLEQVKQAWRELVKVWHPDRFPNDAKMQRKAQERLKAINGAYETLCQFLESGPSQGQANSPGGQARADRQSAGNSAGQGSPPAPPKPDRAATPPPPPKKSKAQRLCLAILLLGALLYAAHLAIEYRAFTSQLTAVKGLHIGDSRDEVKYRLGFPPYVLGPLEDNTFGGRDKRVFTVFAQDNDKNKMPGKVEDYTEWVYEEALPNVRLTVEFSKSGLIDSLNLYSNDEKPGGWGPMAGLCCGDPEEKVLTLGTPSHQDLRDVSKTIEYRDIGLEITLTKGHAYMLTIREPQDRSALFWRFMRGHYRRG